jgi:hypothetical protein
MTNQPPQPADAPPDLPKHTIPSSDEDIVLNLLDDIANNHSMVTTETAATIALVHTNLWIGRSLHRIADRLDDLFDLTEEYLGNSDDLQASQV